MQQRSQIGRSQQQSKDPKEVWAAKKIQAAYLGKKQKKLMEKMRKRYRYRKNVINEIVQTEIGYTNDLNLVCEQVLKPMTEQQIEAQELFNNLPQILEFNTKYLHALKDSFNGFNLLTPYKIVFGGVNDLLFGGKVSFDEAKKYNFFDRPGFECYFTYCSGFTKAMKELEKASPKFKEFMQAVVKKNILKGMDLQSFLVKPVQRLPKYILLYKDLLKNTDDDHPDHWNIAQQLKYFNWVNDENNKNMDTFMNMLKLHDIAQQNSIPKELLTGRNLIFEENLQIIQDSKIIPIYLIALNDLVILCSESKYLKHTTLSPLSFVKDQNDTKYFANLYQLVGQGDTIQLVAEKASQKKTSMTELEKLIDTLREDIKIQKQKLGQKAELEYPIQVVVVGTEERNYQSFTKHTVYITEIAINKVAIKIYLRYSEIQELYKKYSQAHPQLNFPTFPPDSWLTNHKTKIIEQRKLAIEQFLQLILQSITVIEQKVGVLKDLRLPADFYNLPFQMKLHNAKINAQYKNTGQTLEGCEDLIRNNVDVKKMKISAGELLRAVAVNKQTQKINVYSIIDTQIQLWNEQFNQNPEMNHITIILPNGTKTDIGINQTARALSVIKFVTGHNGINYHLDFRLFLIDQLQKSRVIDDDEIVYKVIADEKKNTDGGVLSKLEKMLSKSKDDVIICLKKYITLNMELEEQDYKQDPRRLENLVYSVFDSVKTQKYQLDFKEYCFYAALYYHIHYADMIEGNKNLDELQLDKIKTVVPKELYKGRPEKEWRQATLDLIKQLEGNLTEIKKANNATILRNEKTEFPLVINKKQLAELVVMNSVKQNPLFTRALYFVQTFEKTLNEMKKLGAEIYPNIYLGVSLQGLYFMNPQRKKEFRRFQYDQIQSVKSYPSQIIFEMQNLKFPVRLDTYQSYEIKLLIEEYRHIRKFMTEFNIAIK